MLTNVISSFVPKKSTVLKLISWKHSFKRLNEEYELAKKKKQALDNLFETGRISQSTRDSFNNEIDVVIAEIEKQQQDLLAKMQLKIQDLHSQIKTLEMLLANYEIQHVVGEIDEEIYQREINLLTTGLETAKHELDTIKEAANQLCPPAPAPVTEPSIPQETETIQDQPVEGVPIAPAEVEVATEPCPQEPEVTIEAAPEPEQPPAETEEVITVEPYQAEATEVVPAETTEASEETSQEPVITIEEATSEPAETVDETVSEPVVTVDETVDETVVTMNETVDEPAAIMEEAMSELDQSSAENVEVAPTETLPPVDETTEEDLYQEAHPQEAPKEAHPEIVDEATTEEMQDTAETPPAEEEATAESDESQEDA
jgi:hypothetical protein